MEVGMQTRPAPIERVELSLIVVSYNTRELTLASLRSVVAQTEGVSYEIIVVDNGSADGSADAVAASFPDVTLLRLRENVGFAAGNNLAARLTTGRYLLLLNPDTVVLDGAILRLLAFARSHPDVGIFGGRTLFPDGALNPTSCWNRPTLWSAFCLAGGLSRAFRKRPWANPEQPCLWDCDRSREVDIVSGCFFLIRRALWEQLGGFDPAFFMYGEEADLCLRAARLGHKCMICPEATIIHYGGASERIRADKMVRLFRAKAQLYQRHWSPGRARVGIALLDLWALVRILGFALASPFRPAAHNCYGTWCKIWRERRSWHIPARAGVRPDQAPGADRERPGRVVGESTPS